MGPTKIQGLPAHILLVHLVLAAVPIAALVLVVAALWPAAGRRLGIITPIIALGALPHRSGDDPRGSVARGPSRDHAPDPQARRARKTSAAVDDRPLRHRPPRVAVGTYRVSGPARDSRTCRGRRPRGCYLCWRRFSRSSAPAKPARARCGPATSTTNRPNRHLTRQPPCNCPAVDSFL